MGVLVLLDVLIGSLKKGTFEISIDNISEDNLMKILDNLPIEDIFLKMNFMKY